MGRSTSISAPTGPDGATATSACRFAREKLNVTGVAGELMRGGPWSVAPAAGAGATPEDDPVGGETQPVREYAAQGGPARDERHPVLGPAVAVGPVPLRGVEKREIALALHGRQSQLPHDGVDRRHAMCSWAARRAVDTAAVMRRVIARWWWPR